MPGEWTMQGYEVSVLFLIFVGIILAWELLLGVLTFLNNLIRGKRANWLDRVKEEVLALGVVSLVLLFLSPLLERICNPDESTADNEPVDYSAIPGAYYVCPPGTRNVFPAAIQHAAHYLLFYLAVVHIIFSMITNSITSRKFSRIVDMEREARNADVEFEHKMISQLEDGRQSTDLLIDPYLLESSDDERDDGLDRTSAGSSQGSRQRAGAGGGSTQASDKARAVEKKARKRKQKRWRKHWFVKVFRVLAQSMDQKDFALLRKVCLQRFEAHAMDSNVRSFSYLNIASQVLEADLEQVFAHAWLMIFFMTFLLLYPTLIYQIIWANGICLVALLAMAVKLNSILKGSVQICKNVLRKGVEKQRHLRREEKLLMLADNMCGGGDDTSASPKQAVGRSNSLQKKNSFVPYRSGGKQISAVLGGLPSEQRLAVDSRPLDDGATPLELTAGTIDQLQRALDSPHASAQQQIEAWSIGATAIVQPPAMNLVPAVRTASLPSLPSTPGAASVLSGSFSPIMQQPGALNSAITQQQQGSFQSSHMNMLSMSPATLAYGMHAPHSQAHNSFILFPPPMPPAPPMSAPPPHLGHGGSNLESDYTDPQANSMQQQFGPSNPLFVPFPAWSGRFNLSVAQQAPSITSWQRDLMGMDAGSFGYVNWQPQSGNVTVTGPSVPLARPGLGSTHSAGVEAGATQGHAQHAQYPVAVTGVLSHQLQVAAKELQRLQNLVQLRKTTGAAHHRQQVLGGGSSADGGSERGSKLKRRPARADAVVPVADIKARAQAAVDAKHIRERFKGKSKQKRKLQARMMLEEMHLPYHTQAELAAEVEKRIKSLFWFAHPHTILWIVNIIFLITSLSITTEVAFVIPYAKFQKLAALGHEYDMWVPIIVADVAMAVYLCWFVLPLYALITTAGTSFPPRVIEEIRAAKTMSHEEYHGVSGMVLAGLNHLFVGVELNDLKTELDLGKYFMTQLADHAGIVLSPHLRTHAAEAAIKLLTKPEIRNVLREFAQFWHDLAWYGPPEEDYLLQSDMSFMHSAFDKLDEDGSGALSFGELAQMVRSLGALATAGDIETMLWEVDLDGSRSVGFDEFTKFLVYAFFDADTNGYIGVDEIEDSMKKLGFRDANADSCALLMSAADHNGDGRIGMREFFMLFEKLQVMEEDEEDGSKSGSGKS